MKKHTLIRYLTYIFAGLVFICTAVSVPISAAAKKTLSDAELSKREARYERKEDGKWYQKKTPDLTAMANRIIREIKYSPSITRTDDGGYIFSISAGSRKLAEAVHETVYNDLSRKAVCMFVGDVMCLKGQQYAAQVKGGFDFVPSYSYVAGVFGQADFVCANLETLLSESNPITKDQVNAANGQPQCNGPKVLLTALRKCGFDMVVTANNHTCDWGAKGITETKTHLDEYGFPNVGTHYNTKDSAAAGERYSIINVNGINIAVLSYSHLINQRGYLSSSEMSTMVHCFDRATAKADIEAAKKDGADFVVVYCHWGIENTETLNSAQTDDSKYLAEVGADLIIGSHPHCLQKCTYITTSTGKKVLCMYSMGNFCSSMGRDINNDTIILRVVIERGPSDISNTYVMSEAAYIPCRVTTKDGHSCVVVPVNKKFNGNYSSETLVAAGDRIKKIMNGVIPEYVG